MTNTSEQFGGGIFSQDSRVVIRNSIVRGNISFYGGGIYAESSATTLEDVRIAGNSASGHGGGLFHANGSLDVTNARFEQNSTRWYGGGIHQTGGEGTLINAVIWGNMAEYSGGIYSAGESLLLRNITLARNHSDRNGVGGIGAHVNAQFELVNSVIWENSGQQLHVFSSHTEPVVRHSLIQGGYEGLGNIDLPPVFVNVESGDLRLRIDSPAIDAGMNDGCPPFDIDGLIRPSDGNSDGAAICDMGAHEYGAQPAPRPLCRLPPAHQPLPRHPLPP